MSLASELKFFGVQPLGAQSVPNSSLAFMPALTVKANITGVAASPQDVTTLPVTIGGTGTSTAFTPGSVHFSAAAGAYAQNNARLFWDNTNFRLGLGTNAPAFLLDVQDFANTGTPVRILGGTGGVFLNIQAGAASQQAMINFVDLGGTGKWLMGKQTDNSFLAFDTANSRNWLAITTGGAVTLGETGIGVTILAGLSVTPSQPFTVQPLGNAQNTLTSLFNAVSDVGGGTGLEYGAVLTINTTHNTGSVAPNKVALYTAAVNNNATGGSIWSGNSVVTVGASAPASGFAAQGWEFDVNNSSATARNYTNLASPIYGVSITGVSTQTCTAALFLSGNPGSPQWFAGMVFNQFRSANSATYGIDFGFDASNTIANAWINLPATTSRTFRGGNISQSTAVGPPTVGSLTGLGATGSAAMLNAAPNCGIVTLTVAGAGPAAAGLFTLTWPNAFPTQVNAVAMLLSGSNAWSANATILALSTSPTAVQFQWGNSVALVAGTYQVMYVVIGT